MCHGCLVQPCKRIYPGVAGDFLPQRGSRKHEDGLSCVCLCLFGAGINTVRHSEGSGQRATQLTVIASPRIGGRGDLPLPALLLAAKACYDDGNMKMPRCRAAGATPRNDGLILQLPGGTVLCPSPLNPLKPTSTSCLLQTGYDGDGQATGISQSKNLSDGGEVITFSMSDQNTD